ncbi:carbonic anhydrase-related protein 10-like [Physella acuta]|uniref:carbonic anhydrase-related protein 10-like n=1 Tax=Physella acuta TaxID=109671 RepID=UPI0027DBB84A|nr:carbonic anhydrase-related protein 10-like [Physella acuta]
MYWDTNPDWKLCKFGRQQSPINIEPRRLLYDPNLKHLKIEATTVNGLLRNTGHDILIDVYKEETRYINISLGPLSYSYRVAEVRFHLANNDSVGSEHRVGGRSFPAEMHIIAYNTELYRNLSEAAKGVKGLAIIAVFLEVGKEMDKAFFFIFKDLQSLRNRGDNAQLHDISLTHLIPKTDEYVTYEGSLTQPGCFETVTWILMNKPLRIGKDQLKALRVLFRSRENESNMALEINSRPLMPLNHRVVRTNINTPSKTRLCKMDRDMYYEVNERYFRT